MPTPPYAKLLISVDGAAPQSRGLTVGYEDPIGFVYESTVGWPSTPAPYLELYAYPNGWAPDPADGWVEVNVPQVDGTMATAWRYYGSTPPPEIAAPTAELWGKVECRLVVGGGKVDDRPAPELVDDTTGFQVLSPNLELEDLAHREGAQWGGHRRWTKGVAENFRKIDANVSGGSSVPTSRKLNVSGGLTVSPSDGVLDEDLTFGLSGINDSQHGSRAGGTLHSTATTSVAGFMSSADKTKLDGLPSASSIATSASTPLRLSGTALDWYPTANVSMSPDGTNRGFTGASGLSGPAPTVTATTGPLTLDPTTLVKVVRNAIGPTAQPGLRLANETAAVSPGATQQLSPALEMLGQAWASGANKTMGVRLRAVPRTSGNVSLVAEYTTNGGTSWSSAFGWDTSNAAIYNEGFWAYNYYVSYHGNIEWENGGARLSCGYAQGLQIYSYEAADPLYMYSECAVLVEIASGEQIDLGPELCQLTALQTNVKQLTSTPQVVNHSASGARTLDLANGQNWEITLGANLTSLTVTNAKRGARISIAFRQDATGGRTVVFGSPFVATTAMGSALNTVAEGSTSYLFGVNNASQLFPLSAPYSFAT